MSESLSYAQLESYIREQMRMSHIYQPVMLRVLLEQGGTASIEDIAKALLSYDRSQVEYYEIRTKNMVGKVLTQNSIAEPIKNGRRITGYKLSAEELSEEEIATLKQRCDDRLNSYLEKRGEGIWGHRAVSDGYIPGSVRYEVLKRAKYRCELCGAHEDQAALHIDHILPRARGGSDDISNFQALCVTCNTNKRDRDDADFRGVLDSYENRQDGCIFCDVDESRVIAENELSYAIRDGFPVTPMHTLIIPKRHVADYFDLYQPELNAMHALLAEQRSELLGFDATIEGFNVGINAGGTAGQTIFHVHVHLIPRRAGDVEDPKGGVRGVIPAKQKY
ncbi:HIT family protein [Rhodovulum sp. 12E13]|uniref:HIT family protein n=1 Tax=Rhodovulum sp. 12E13 TaxID=2203891 RepID=UPI0018F5393A|nr:HIT family protein [Rhodovulum sp. 12E13]